MNITMKRHKERVIKIKIILLITLKEINIFLQEIKDMFQERQVILIVSTIAIILNLIKGIWQKVFKEDKLIIMQ